MEIYLNLLKSSLPILIIQLFFLYIYSLAFTNAGIHTKLMYVLLLKTTSYSVTFIFQKKIQLFTDLFFSIKRLAVQHLFTMLFAFLLTLLSFVIQLVSNNFNLDSSFNPLADHDSQKQNAVILYIYLASKLFILYPTLFSFLILIEEYVMHRIFLKNLIRMNPNKHWYVFKQCLFISTLNLILNFPLVYLNVGVSTVDPKYQIFFKLFLIYFSIELNTSIYFSIFQNYLMTSLLKSCLMLFFYGMPMLVLRYSYYLAFISLVIFSLLLLASDHFLKTKLFLSGDDRQIQNGKKIFKKENGNKNKNLIKKGEEKEQGNERKKKKKKEKEKENENEMEKENEIKKEKENEKNEENNKGIYIFKNRKKRTNLTVLLKYILFLILMIALIILILLLIFKMKGINNCDSDNFVTFSDKGFLNISKCLGISQVEIRKYYSKGKYQNYETMKYIKPFQIKINKKENLVVYAKCKSYFGSKVKVFPHYPFISKRKLEMQNRTKNEDPVTKAFKPNIVTIMFDGASKYSYRGSLTKSIQTLEDFQKNKKIKYWSFEGYRTYGEHSFSNQLPLFGFHETRSIPIDSNDWVWNYFKNEKGYITAFVDELCYQNDTCQKRYGVNIEAPRHLVPFDYRFLSPFCDTNWSPYKNDSVHCLYGQYGHNVLFQSLHKLMKTKNHHNLAKFVVSILYESHESSLTILKSVDDDFATFLSNFLNEKENKNTILIILSDHGIHYGKWSEKNHKWPVFDLIIPKRVLKKMKGVEKNLNHNLNSKFCVWDIYQTYKHLANYPQNVKVSRNYRSLLNKIPDRSCAQVRFHKPAYCDAWVN
ncbi:hypothetical protein M0813_13962 [Anaeramoeba flamelloides]|uniref:Sulfatase N-terminal domain-containing protein n=1 Tax=Anaeramoeba flamelloides TaxID=1746091 RepID=A0ABQ8Z784_9EUKA|nr:hypothetical protein M0813_13962 [Anaeramoeba flamelloides]